MAVIKPALVSPKQKSRSVRWTLGELCYYYPQYTLNQARKLPARDVFLLLKVARRKESEKYLNLVQIVAAPHTKKGSGVDKLIKEYKKALYE